MTNITSLDFARIRPRDLAQQRRWSRQRRGGIPHRLGRSEHPPRLREHPGGRDFRSG
jgi:hypothetical protein